MIVTRMAAQAITDGLSVHEAPALRARDRRSFGVLVNHVQSVEDASHRFCKPGRRGQPLPRGGAGRRRLHCRGCADGAGRGACRVVSSTHFRRHRLRATSATSQPNLRDWPMRPAMSSQTPWMAPATDYSEGGPTASRRPTVMRSTPERRHKDKGSTMYNAQGKISQADVLTKLRTARCVGSACSSWPRCRPASISTI